MTKVPTGDAVVRQGEFARKAAQPMSASPPGPNGTTQAPKIKPNLWAGPPPTLTKEELARIPAGASSTEALIKATGGQIEQIGRISDTNAIILNINDRRLIYIRPQALGQGRNTEYKTGYLRKKLDPNNQNSALQLDHVASTGVEGKRMGMIWVLAAFVEAKVNQSHGVKVEKGPVPVREAAKAFQGGIDHRGEHHVTYMTQEMVDKLAGKHPTLCGHGILQNMPSPNEMKHIERALMQDPATQRHLASLGSQQTAAAKQSSRTKTKGKDRSR